MFPAEPCFFHVVKNGETGARILARYNSPEVTLFFEDLSAVPENLYILKRERPLRFKNAWDYLLPDDVIVFPRLTRTILWEVRLVDLTNQVSWLETTLTILGEQMRDLKEDKWPMLFFFLPFGVAVVFLVLAVIIAVTRIWRTIASKRAQNQSGA
jgi:hypothetical protein